MEKIISLHKILKDLLKDICKVSLETDKKTGKKMIVIRDFEKKDD